MENLQICEWCFLGLCMTIDLDTQELWARLPV
jgi:hypothetical protein